MTPEREAELRHGSRVAYHERRVELLQQIDELRRCAACASVPHACRTHPPDCLRRMLLEAFDVLSV